MVLFVILKCNSNSSFLTNPYFHTFNWPLRVLIVKKENPDQCPHSKLFSGFRACLILFDKYLSLNYQWYNQCNFISAQSHAWDEVINNYKPIQIFIFQVLFSILNIKSTVISFYICTWVVQLLLLNSSFLERIERGFHYTNLQSDK